MQKYGKPPRWKKRKRLLGSEETLLLSRFVKNLKRYSKIKKKSDLLGLAVAMVESEEDGEGSKNGSGGDGSHGMKMNKN